MIKINDHSEDSASLIKTDCEDEIESNSENIEIDEYFEDIKVTSGDGNLKTDTSYEKMSVEKENSLLKRYCKGLTCVLS